MRDIFGDIKVPTNIESSTKKYLIHPVILDNCLQVLGSLFTKKEQESNLYLPLSIDSFVFHSPIKNEILKLRSIGKIRDSHMKNRNLYVADVMIFDSSNALIAEVNGICFKRIDKAESQQRSTFFDLTYQIQWEKQRKHRASLQLPKGLCLIFSDESGVGESLKESMRSKGVDAKAIYHDPSQKHAQTVDSTRHCVNLADADSLNNVLEELSTKYQKPISDIVFACSMDYACPDPLVTQLEESQKVLCGNLLTIIQAMVKNQKLHSTRLSILVPKIFRVTDNQKNISLLPSSITGLINVLNIEYPQLSCKIIDTDQGTNTNNLLREIFLKDNTSQVAYRHNTRYLAKLVKLQQIE